MAVAQILDPLGQPQQDWQFLDWKIAQDGTRVNPHTFVHKKPGLYAAAQGAVAVNDLMGPTAKLYKCDQNDFNANLWQDDWLIAANDPNGSILPQSTPITLNFAIPLLAVGAYVVVTGKAAIFGLPVEAVMWVQEAGADDWTPIHGSGTVGEVLIAGTAASAAFVGAVSLNGSSIGKVCFDASIAGSFKTLGVSRLFWVA